MDGDPKLTLNRLGHDRVIAEFPKHRADPFPAMQRVWDKLNAGSTEPEPKAESAHERCVRMVQEINARRQGGRR